jgi:transcriptional regulator with XRE-family HTH domain
MNTLGSRVAKARQTLDLSPSEFAKELGIGRAAISKIESNMTKTINLDTALAIQNLTGVSAYWIRTGKGPMEHSSLKDEQIARIAAKLADLPDDAKDKIESDIDYIASLQ